MTSVTLPQILNAVTNTLKTSPLLVRAMAYDQLTDGVNDTPTLQVYLDDIEQDPTNETAQTSFRGVIRQTALTIACDYYAQQRRHIGEDMAKLVEGIDALTTIFEAQKTAPYFGLAAIKAFHWKATRVTFDYGATGIKYVGARYTLTLRIF